MKFLRSTFAILAASLAAQVYALELNPRFFPEIKQTDAEWIRLKGLAELYPQRILFEAPSSLPQSQRYEAAKYDTVRENINYIRVYRLHEAMPILMEHIDDPYLILDLRYLRAPSLGLELAHMLGLGDAEFSLKAMGEIPAKLAAQLAPMEKAPSTRRETPIVVLCNRETSGPFEATLQTLQDLGAVFAVGENTAGKTGFYQKMETQPAWVLNGEIRPESNISLINLGFSPRIQIQTSQEENYASYNLYEAGTPLDRLLDSKQESSESDETDSSFDYTKPDRVLQRGVDIVAALQILQ